MGKITVVGTGWTMGQLTLDAVEAFRSGSRIILHTDHSGCAQWLKENNIAFESLDELYESCEDFDEHVEAAVEAVLEAAETDDVIYGVLDIRDRSVCALAAQAAEDLCVIAGPSAEGALLAFINGASMMLEASDWEDFQLSAGLDCLIRELDNRELAAEVKLKLMEVYPEECDVWVQNGNSAPVRVPLYDLDRMERYDHRTCVLIPAEKELTNLERYDFNHLNEIMRLLCGPFGCPWDRAQTHESLRTCILEEAYEVIEAIDDQDTDHLYDELGDMLLQIAMHAEIARKHGEFDISDITTAISEKMIERHTHIFGKDRAGDPDQVLDLWNKNKKIARGQKTQTEVLKSITKTLPALLRALKVLKRSKDAGMCEQNVEDVSRKAIAAIQALTAGDAEKMLGDILFMICDIARFMKVDPEIALNRASDRFIDRFEDAENKLLSTGATFESIDAEMLHKYWDLVKL